MYWYSPKLRSVAVLIGGLLVVALLPACKPTIENNGAFDLKGYFTKAVAVIDFIEKQLGI